MGNTVFYRQLNENADQITWKDIFSEYNKKHDKQDFEYAIAAGTALNSASEEYMLQKWRKPWIFYTMLKWGIALIILLYVVYFGLQVTGIGSVVPAIGQMAIIIPPLIAPAVLMVLFWEMNIPRNMSILELFGMWLIGGFASLVIANLFFIVLPDGLPICINAPAAEEPAKLIAALLMMAWFSRNKKLYGINGFVIGATVGAGFAGFESVQYAFNSAQSVMTMQGEAGQIVQVVQTSMSGSVVYSQILRLLLSVGGHVMYCAPYSAEVARNTKNGKITISSILNINVILVFLASSVIHGLWNNDVFEIPGGRVGYYMYLIVLITLLWILGLKVLRRSLNQVVKIGASASGGEALKHGASIDANASMAEKMESKPLVKNEEMVKSQPQQAVSSNVSIAHPIKVTCVSGELSGQSWQLSENGVLLIGRTPDCGVRFSPNAKGVSGRHCSIQSTQMGWTIKDLGSTYGTFISNNQKLVSGMEVKLNQGDVISLGGAENALVVNLK